MRFLFMFGLLLLGLLPASVILSLLVYKLYNDFRKKRFEKNGCVVLTREKIGSILESSQPSELLRIFKSAICDHSKVQDVRYYTKYPFGSKIIIAHDNHRKAFIANEIGQMLTRGMIHNGDMELYRDILFFLTGHSKETYYTQIIAWNNLSLLASFTKMPLLEFIGIDYLKNCLLKDFITGTGVLQFLFNLKNYYFKSYDELARKSANIVNDLIFFTLDVDNLPLLALLVFKLTNSPYFDKKQKKYFMQHLPEDPKFNRFIENMDKLSLGFTKEELKEGLKNLGLQSAPYSQKTTESEIVRILIKNSLEEIYIPPSYMLHTFDCDDLRQYITDFLWS